MSNTQDEAQESLRKKQLLYDELETSLASDDDETPDQGRISSVQVLRKGFARKQQLELSKVKKSTGLSRSISDSNVEKTTTTSKGLQEQLSPSRTLASSDPGNKAPAPLKIRHTLAGSQSKTMDTAPPSSSRSGKTAVKRKRETSVKEVPAEHQIFTGLRFYFFPNTDTHPARKMRIAKALEFGATWKKEFDDTVTHAIVDKTLDYTLLTKFLKMDVLPSTVIVVSENYPAECISYRRLLNPLQIQFKVKGYTMPSVARPASSDSNQSLPLKAAGKSVEARLPETLSVDEGATAILPPPGTSQNERTDDERPLPADSQPSSKAQIPSTEEFDVAIRLAQDLQHVPLDTEDEGSSRPSSSDSSTTEGEKYDNGFGFHRKKTSKYQCMQKHTGTNESPNAATVAILQRMADYYNEIGDEWRTRGYRKAIATLRNHPTKVWTKEDAASLPQIGERLAMKIEEIAFTNRLRRFDHAIAEPEDQVLQTFMKVYGVGFAQASKWVRAGYTTLDELLERAELTNNQRIGIEHYEDFNSRIPRSEVEQHGNIVRKTLQKIDSTFEVIVGGSYRRGSETSGDIDCIITGPNTDIAHIRQIVLDQLVPTLFANNFLVAELAATSRDDGSKWHGASTIPTNNVKTRSNPWRRIDLLLVPSDEIGAALIYFTGNDIFNRSMRLLASTKGMCLNQRGLYKDAIRGKGREKLSKGTLVEGKDEKKIFEALGVPWRPPEHRIC